MRYSTSILCLAAPLAAFAAPAKFYGKRSDTDILVLKFADVLEQFESSFYQSALSKFQASDFTAAGFVSPSVPTELFSVIQADEATHSSTLQSALKSSGQQPITSCTFNFDSALTDVATMAATARVVENLGVSAYLGAAPLLSDPVLLQAAGSILTVEARHQTVLNLLSGTGSAIPQAFDIGFTPQEVLAVASPFLNQGCDLGVTANPTLTITNTGSVGPGTLLTFESSAINGSSSSNSFCQMMVGGAAFSISLPLSACVVPQGIDGPVAIWITSDSQPLLNNVRDRATSQLVAGPTMAFVDTSPQTIGQLVRSSAAVSSSNGTASVTTSTISPEQASSIISSASAQTATAAAAASATVSAGNASGAAASTAAIAASPTGPSGDGKITVLGFS
ncbi:ferritin-like domain-containing protein [Desarmillaria tabescens]|uniref:Ferritin-like domain-containing protein n=1 Tax=Armillaria tabescens TaxID=1929756 RepID=A0AA39NL91_ARMTA|nr:ferritin-like domain-containing protein [Desarmillaria tabescens]KAK0467716.1 ferritin-like domain-containing protein [Desarmillaria tabescens]